jgi:hypothetical protein
MAWVRASRRLILGVKLASHFASTIRIQSTTFARTTLRCSHSTITTTSRHDLIFFVAMRDPGAQIGSLDRRNGSAQIYFCLHKQQEASLGQIIGDLYRPSLERALDFILRR